MGWEVEEAGKPKVGQSIHSDTNSSAVPSVGNIPYSWFY